MSAAARIIAELVRELDATRENREACRNLASRLTLENRELKARIAELEKAR